MQNPCRFDGQAWESSGTGQGPGKTAGSRRLWFVDTLDPGVNAGPSDGIIKDGRPVGRPSLNGSGAPESHQRRPRRSR